MPLFLFFDRWKLENRALGSFDTGSKSELALRLDELVFERCKFPRVWGFDFERTDLPAVHYDDRIEPDRPGGFGANGHLLGERAKDRESFGFDDKRIGSYRWWRQESNQNKTDDHSNKMHGRTLNPVFFSNKIDSESPERSSSLLRFDFLADIDQRAFFAGV